MKSARRLSDAGQLNAAMDNYNTAYARWHSNWLLINIGRIQQKQGHPADAIGTYERYLANSAGDSADRIEAARGFLNQAKQDLEQKRKQDAELASRRPEKPVYKKWWFWTAVGGAAVLAAGVTAGAVLGTRASASQSLPENTGMFTF